MAYKKISFSAFAEKRVLLDAELAKFLSPLNEAVIADYYWSEEDQSGFAIDESGYLFSVFALKRGRGASIVQAAIGGWCFKARLPRRAFKSSLWAVWL